MRNPVVDLGFLLFVFSGLFERGAFIQKEPRGLVVLFNMSARGAIIMGKHQERFETARSENIAYSASPGCEALSPLT